MSYKKSEVKKIALDYFDGDELAPDVFAKYALQNQDGEYLEASPDQMHRRLAREFHRIEMKYKNPMSEDEIFDLFKGFNDVIPQGSPMSGIGNNFQLQSLSNCFVIDPAHDSYSGILFTDQEQVQIMKRRGGVGHDVTNIRPKGMTTSNAAKTTDGLAVFMERFSNSTREVAQGGRRGALMMTIDCRHPEIETFIDIKRDLKKVTGANISIRWTDEFMEAVRDDKEFVLHWPVGSKNPEIQKVVNARQIWNKFIDATHASAEPGALFWDTLINNSIADCYSDVGYKTISTNPCGELPLSPYDSCRLMVNNLTSFVLNPFMPNARFDFERFGAVVEKAQRLMDDLIDLEIECVDRIINKIENDPEPASVKRVELDLWNKIRKTCLNGRRTGLGITGLGDALAALGLKYGQPDSVEMTEKIYKHLAIWSHISSVKMAAERGNFPVFSYEKEKNHEYLNKIMNAASELYPAIIDMWKYTGRRNIANTTTAPVGSGSCLTRTTSGIEPSFLLSYKRRRKITQGDFDSRVDYVDSLGDKWQEYTVYHHWFKKWMDITGKTNVEESPYWQATANDINWEDSVKIQAAAQRWVDHSISKTCNLPNNATKELVHEIYMKAWSLGCKGFTIYRDGCRDGVLINDTPPAEVKKADDTRQSPKRPKVLPCDIHRATIRNGDTTESWLVLVGLNEGKPYEVFCGMPHLIEFPKKYKSGSIVKNRKRSGATAYNLHIPVGDSDNLTFNDITDLFNNPTEGAFTRTISLALRHNVPLHYVVEQLQKDKNSDIFSYARVISRVLKGYIKDGTKTTGNKCPNCDEGELIYQEGCLSCKSCGHAKCG
jgi:ribonucleoside-diphosphate reductase alpha chain